MATEHESGDGGFNPLDEESIHNLISNVSQHVGDLYWDQWSPENADVEPKMSPAELVNLVIDNSQTALVTVFNEAVETAGYEANMDLLLQSVVGTVLLQETASRLAREFEAHMNPD
jgi:hypothetical protein